MNYKQFLQGLNTLNQVETPLTEKNHELKCYSSNFHIRIKAKKTKKFHDLTDLEIGEFLKFQLKSTSHFIIKELPKNVEFIYIKIPDYITLTLIKEGQN